MSFVKKQNPTQNKSDFTSISDLIQNQIHKLSDKPLTKTISLHNQWKQIAGPVISKHSKVLYLRGGELVISVTNSTWHSELIMMKAEILDKINQAMPEANVEEIKFKISS